ncbi:MarR family transcriptional regulator [Halovenus marina]|uniref:MarR family transcriptional regulator n=1 Tax=Halovenus marina TaxID=3396621 RepID=UPI003F54D2AB
MTTNGGSSTRAESLPPSAAYVLDKIEADEPVTRQQLLSETYLSERTLSRALETLQNGGYISLEQNPEDLRQVVATLAGKRTYNPPESDTS